MAKVLLLAIALAIASPIAAATAEPPGVRLTVLYDNWVGVEGTEADWGFAVLVERGKHRVLFDTGTKDWVLRHNLRALEVDLSTVEAVVLSHDHGDHTGGLFSVLESHHDLTVYAPSSFTATFANEVRHAGAKVVIDGDPRQVAPGISTSGTFGGDIPEQALVVETGAGLLVVTGCAHPGVVEIVRQVATTSDRKVDTVLGGFHLMRHSSDEVAEVMTRLEALGVRSAGPSHCSGKPATDAFREHFGERFVALGTGRVVTID
jgi:7,8-dihydropterin-6-yl-methyl-4-(beta-D-ribofuranosyl)aminobenzene 5'-phosphate synthase